ncbi:type VII toxin-antitoxin system MntA family adenylyltransferase antitoxin [Calorimonas adulescens]|uniref:Nucleotidyltransferase domain-containing protein n=1 Tax=Calorimonas adulescens TaxID=2606906 RepID=A0A5D8QAA7_9THEO|nr:nucleotidyltransferase domain-containing protein [Calorimonas adulescens]TZE81327.1 nucleotidyltransferase domain-containing protein [Calorimonas adulescens]
MDLFKKITGFLCHAGFGSYSKRRQFKESDVDIAVYLKEGYTFDDITMLWGNLEDITRKDVDLIILNSANPIIAWEAIRGSKLLIRDEELYIKYMLDISMEAEDLSNDLMDIYRMRKEVVSLHSLITKLIEQHVGI